MSIRIYGNRELKTLPGLDCRPTPIRVRQALFNIWQGQVLGCRWLDLCSGSGSMAAEALCRGATMVLGIEESPIACQMIRENCQKLIPAGGQFRLINGRIQKFLPSLVGQQFDRIYCDPPYQGNLYQRAINAIEEHHLLAPDGEIALEHGSERNLKEEIETKQLTVCRQKKYGSVSLTFFAHSQRLPVQNDREPDEG